MVCSSRLESVLDELGVDDVREVHGLLGGAKWRSAHVHVEAVRVTQEAFAVRVVGVVGDLTWVSKPLEPRPVSEEELFADHWATHGR